MGGGTGGVERGSEVDEYKERDELTLSEMFGLHSAAQKEAVSINHLMF